MKLFLVNVILSCLISISTPRYIFKDFDLPQPPFDSFGHTLWNSRQTFQTGNIRHEIRDTLRSQRSDRHRFPDDIFPDDIFDEIRRQSSNRHIFPDDIIDDIRRQSSNSQRSPDDIMDDIRRQSSNSQRFPDDIIDDIRRQSSNSQRSPDDIMDDIRRQSSYIHRSPDDIIDELRRQSSNIQRSPDDIMDDIRRQSSDIFPRDNIEDMQRQRRLQDVLDEIIPDFEYYFRSLDDVENELNRDFAGLDSAQRADMICSHCTSRGYARCITNYCSVN